MERERERARQRARDSARTRTCCIRNDIRNGGPAATWIRATVSACVAGTCSTAAANQFGFKL